MNTSKAATDLFRRFSRRRKFNYRLVEVSELLLPVDGAPAFFVFEVVVGVFVVFMDASEAVALPLADGFVVALSVLAPDEVVVPVAVVVSAAPVLGGVAVAALFAPGFALFIVDSVLVVVSVCFSTGFVQPTAAIESRAATATAACVLFFI